MPDDKNIKLMLFCSHCLRRRAMFAARPDESLLLAWNYILHLPLSRSLPGPLTPSIPRPMEQRHAVASLPPGYLLSLTLSLFLGRSRRKRVTSSVSPGIVPVSALGFVLSFVRFLLKTRHGSRYYQRRCARIVHTSHRGPEDN